MIKEKSKEHIGEKIKSLRISPWMAGATIGFLAASLQKIASMIAPPAYGFCMACHARDLINSVVNQIAGTDLGVASIVTSIPTLTVIGILLGSFVAAILFKEFRISKGGSYISYLKMFVLGILVMNFALILSACPVRTSLRVAHGDTIAMVGLLCIGIGAILATVVLEKRVEV
jgi:hypothetical protein